MKAATTPVMNPEATRFVVFRSPLFSTHPMRVKKSQQVSKVKNSTAVIAPTRA